MEINSDLKDQGLKCSHCNENIAVPSEGNIIKSGNREKTKILVLLGLIIIGIIGGGVYFYLQESNAPKKRTKSERRQNGSTKKHRYLGYTNETNISTARTHLKMLESSLHAFHLDIGCYPTADEGLNALVEKPDNCKNWNGPYIRTEVPKDPWGNDYVYITPGEHGDFDLLSYGADGRPGGAGKNADITSFIIEE